MPALHGRFRWYELATTDVPGAIAFYSDVLGWKAEPFPAGEPSLQYHVWRAPEGSVGGVMELPEEARRNGAPPHWLGYVGTPDVDGTLAQAQALGASVVAEPLDIPGVGRIALFDDPQGAGLAIFRPDGPSSDDPPGERGVAWRELYTSDPDAAWAFYANLFGWQQTDRFDLGPQMGRYQMFGTGAGTPSVGGMMKWAPPPGVQAPPHWNYYLTVADLDRALERAKALGARVLFGPMAVPRGGRCAQGKDPQGAVFSLFEPPRP